MAGVRAGALYGGLPYLAFGHGPPLVALAGLSAEHANPTGMQRRGELRPLRPLARRFTVYLVNRRPGVPRGSTIADLAGDYATAIEREFAGPVAVHGVSTGGSIAQQLAIDHPGLVRRLVLVASACRLSPYGRRVQRRLADCIAAGDPRRGWSAVGPALAATRTGGGLMAAVMWAAGASMTPRDPADLLVTIAAEDAFDATADLHRIGAPTLLIAGERDAYYSPELFRRTAQLIPDARLLLYPGKGHAATTSYRPGIREILRFLTADGDTERA